MIEPKILKGTRDFGPEEMSKRLYVINKLRSIFEINGYQPIETPAIEYAETILGKYGDEGDQLTYTFKDRGDRELALRYDQTVPTARFVAMNYSQLPIPFKRYQIGPVWRADKPQRGRYREFYQCDIDIIGTDSLLADAQIARVVYQGMKALKIENFVIRVNSRKLMDELLNECGVKKTDRLQVIRIIDKLDKISLSEVENLLSEIIKTEQVEWLSDNMLSEKVKSDPEQLADVPAKKDIQQLFSMFQSMSISPENIMLDLTLARGLDYYTGTIFEVVIPESGLGSVCGGGRYDNLTSMFSKKAFPGTGVAFGVDRLMVYLTDNNLLTDVQITSQIMIANFPETLSENLRLLDKLQNKGIRSEIYTENNKLDKQFKYANKKAIPWVILQGEEELKKGIIMLRNMNSGEQEALTFEQIIKKIK